MRFKKTKLFWSKDTNGIKRILYDDNTDYYAFLRKCRNDGYHQVIITAEVMIQIIRYACLDKGYKVYKIEFIEDDVELESDISSILQRINNNPGYLSDLLEKLKFLAEKSSIDLKRIYIKEEYISDSYINNFFVQSNGIIGVSEEAYDVVSTEISAVVERCLVG